MKNILRLLESFHRVTVTLKDSGVSSKDIVSTLSLHSKSLCQVAATLKDSGVSSKDIVSTLNLHSKSFCQVAAMLKDSGSSPKDIVSVLSLYSKSLYRMAAILKDSGSPPKDIVSALNLYIEGMTRITTGKYFVSNTKKVMKGLEDAFSDGQLKSKLWLIQVLKEKNLSSLGTVFLCAGWYGALAFLLMTDGFFKLKHCFLFERDPLSVKVSEDLNRFFVKKNWKFKASLKDILELDYLTGRFQTLKANGTVEEMQHPPDTIINTACEHIERFDVWWSQIPPKKLLILQSNNYFNLPEHVNCVSSLREFKKQAANMDLLYEGILDMKRYKRFLLIGYKSA